MKIHHQRDMSFAYTHTDEVINHIDVVVKFYLSHGDN